MLRQAANRVFFTDDLSKRIVCEYVWIIYNMEWYKSRGYGQETIYIVVIMIMIDNHENNNTIMVMIIIGNENDNGDDNNIDNGEHKHIQTY